MFQQEVIPDRYRQVPIHQIKPDINLKELGVDVFQATPEGIAAVYQHGWDKGREFLTAESGQPQRADPAPTQGARECCPRQALPRSAFLGRHKGLSRMYVARVAPPFQGRERLT